jgi:hypothetical protein
MDQKMTPVYVPPEDKLLSKGFISKMSGQNERVVDVMERAGQKFLIKAKSTIVDWDTHF